MSSLANRTLPPTLWNGMCLPCCKRRTPATEILKTSATSGMVNSSIAGPDSVGIFVKEQYRVGKPNCRRTIQLYHFLDLFRESIAHSGFQASGSLFLQKKSAMPWP